MLPVLANRLATVKLELGACPLLHQIEIYTTQKEAVWQDSREDYSAWNSNVFDLCLPIQTTPLDKKRAQGKEKNGLKKKKKLCCKQEMVK